jgi:hypothetical protein
VRLAESWIFIRIQQINEFESNFISDLSNTGYAKMSMLAQLFEKKI